MDKRGTQINESNDDVQGFSHKSWLCQKKKKKKNEKKKKKGGRELVSIKDCIDATVQRLERYSKKCKEKLITTANNSNDNIKTNRKITKSRK